MPLATQELPSTKPPARTQEGQQPARTHQGRQEPDSSRSRCTHAASAAVHAPCPRLHGRQKSRYDECGDMTLRARSHAMWCCRKPWHSTPVSTNKCLGCNHQDVAQRPRQSVQCGMGGRDACRHRVYAKCRSSGRWITRPCSPELKGAVWTMCQANFAVGTRPSEPDCLVLVLKYNVYTKELLSCHCLHAAVHVYRHCCASQSELVSAMLTRISHPPFTVYFLLSTFGPWSRL